MRRPDLSPRVMKLEREYVNSLLGLNIAASEISDLLQGMRYGVEVKGDVLFVSVPPYRSDVLHPMDLVEDVAIAYGYQNFMPEEITTHTLARGDQIEKKISVIRDALIGLDFTEVMNLVMTNREILFKNMELPEEPVVCAENPASLEHAVCRNWLLPSLMNVLAKNKTREFPQKVFEVGDVLSPSGENKKNVSGVVSHAKTNFSEIKSIVDGLLSTLNVEYKIMAVSHPSFIHGRCASLEFGFFGEIHPKVLSNFGLEMPATAFELKLDDILSRK